MKFPLYIYFEILLRLSEFVPNIGNYRSVSEIDGMCLIRTSTGQIEVPKDLLALQFSAPDEISRERLLELGKEFQIGGREYSRN